VRVIAIDWSGALRNARQHIWLAEAERPGRLVRLEAGRDRRDVAGHLTELASSRRADGTSPELVVGFDFAFSFPVWFIAELGVRSAPELWAYVAGHADAWLSACEPPFWGRPGKPRPVPSRARPPLRRADLAVPRTAGVAPKSIFQIGGAGAVGTGSLRGMPVLAQLASAGARVWPYCNDGGRPTLLEIYPRLMTGAVRKSHPIARANLLALRYPHLAAAHRQSATASEDAFDAAVSALVMVEHVADLGALPVERDPVLRLEGRIWHPGWRTDPPA
jgi:hypothetical protein